MSIVHSFCVVLPPVLVPRQSVYPKPAAVLPSEIGSVDDPSMPYNVTYPFTNQPTQREHSFASSFNMPGEYRISAIFPVVALFYAEIMSSR